MEKEEDKNNKDKRKTIKTKTKTKTKKSRTHLVIGRGRRGHQTPRRKKEATVHNRYQESGPKVR